LDDLDLSKILSFMILAKVFGLMAYQCQWLLLATS
jgi:hypothetical protein